MSNFLNNIRQLGNTEEALKYLGAKLANIFKDITGKQAKQIYNSQSLIDGQRVYFVVNEPRMGLTILINDKELIPMPFTAGQQRSYYPLLTRAPFIIKFAKDMVPNLVNGEYISLSAYSDGTSSTKIEKRFSAGDLIIETTNPNADVIIQVGLQNYGSDLVLGEPYLIEVDNQAGYPMIESRVVSEYYQENFVGSVATKQYTNWDYVTFYGLMNISGATNQVEVAYIDRQSGTVLQANNWSPGGLLSMSYTFYDSTSPVGARDFIIRIKDVVLPQE